MAKKGDADPCAYLEGLSSIAEALKVDDEEEKEMEKRIDMEEYVEHKIAAWKKKKSVCCEVVEYKLQLG